jgi:pyocin large subunit-like protein
VQNLTGDGFRTFSTEIKAKPVSKLSNTKNGKHKDDNHETKVKEGTAKRNIIRKKTADKDTGNYNSCHKKQGGNGKGQWREEMDQFDENDTL